MKKLAISLLALLTLNAAQAQDDHHHVRHHYGAHHHHRHLGRRKVRRGTKGGIWSRTRRTT